MSTVRRLSSVVLVLLALIGGIVIIVVVGLLNNNFFPKQVPVEILLTKSPLRVTYKGNKTPDLETLVKDAKDFPFEDYKFNENLTIKVDTKDSAVSSSNTGIDLKQNSTNTLNTLNTFNTQTTQEN